MDNWTTEERRKHAEGRALMQSARDTRRNRIEREERERKARDERNAAAQKAADERHEKECDDRIRAFMEDFVALFSKHNVTLVTIEPVYAGTPMNLFKLALRNTYRSPDYVVSCTPGRGFAWRK